MKNKRNQVYRGIASLVVIILIFVILAVGIGGVYYYRKSVQNQMVSDEFNRPPVNYQSPALSTAHWITYRNDKYGFEIKYPSQLVIGGRSAISGTLHTPLQNSDTVFEFIENVPSDSETLQVIRFQLAIDALRGTRTAWSTIGSLQSNKDAGPSLRVSQVTKFLNFPARIVENCIDPGCNSYLEILQGDRVFRLYQKSTYDSSLPVGISADTGLSEKDSIDKNNAFREDMIATFKFTNTHTTTTSISPTSGSVGSVATLTTHNVYCHCMSDRFKEVVFIKEGQAFVASESSYTYSQSVAPDGYDRHSITVPASLAPGLYQVGIQTCGGKGSCEVSDTAVFTVK